MSLRKTYDNQSDDGSRETLTRRSDQTLESTQMEEFIAMGVDTYYRGSSTRSQGPLRCENIQPNMTNSAYVKQTDS